MTDRFSQLTHLGNLPVETFLKEYWQKKPLLIRNAFPHFSSLISADELAGLAIEDDVTSRLVTENKTNKTWSIQHGPLPEDIFNTLPEKNWSLLVQYADSLDPRLNNLVNAFRFIPSWRIDDIMVSFAADGGGVGPHFDYFDVFLLQAEGNKHWRIGQKCSAMSPLVPNSPMKILESFNTTEDWNVDPGDVLYIPARFAHWGESIGNSLTYSVGFRAPSHSDILLEYSQELAAYTSEQQRYEDPDLSLQAHSGEISSSEHQKIKEILRSHYSDDEKLQRWLGEYTTQMKQAIDAQLLPISPTELKTKTNCSLNPFCRSAFSTVNNKTMCFVNGVSWPCSLELAITLTDYSNFSPNTFSNKDDKETIEQLARYGFLEAN